METQQYWADECGRCGDPVEYHGAGGCAVLLNDSFPDDVCPCEIVFD